MQSNLVILNKPESFLRSGSLTIYKTLHQISHLLTDQSFPFKTECLDIYRSSEPYYQEYTGRQQTEAIWQCAWQVAPNGYKPDNHYSSSLCWLLGAPETFYSKHCTSPQPKKCDVFPMDKDAAIVNQSPWTKIYLAVKYRWRSHYIGPLLGNFQGFFIAESSQHYSKVTLVSSDPQTNCLAPLPADQHCIDDEGITNTSADAQALYLFRYHQSSRIVKHPLL